MTVSAQETIFRHVGNGVTTVFAYGCQVLQPNDLYVYVDGIEITSGITKNGIGSLTGGTVTFSVAPANGAAIIIEREVALERTTDYQQNGDFLARVVNPDFNRIWMVLQQLLSGINRALRFPKSDINPITELPNAATRADKLLSFDSNGNPIVVAPSAGTATALSVALASSSGSGLIGYLNGVANTVYRTLVDRLREQVSVKDFGAIGDGTGDDLAAINLAIAYVKSVRGRLIFPLGTYRISAAFNLSGTNNVEYYSEGATILCYGAGPVVKMDSGMGAYNDNVNMLGVWHLRGNALTTDAYYSRGHVRSVVDTIEVKNAATSCWRLEWSVLVQYRQLTTTNQSGAFTTAPTYGLILDKSGSARTTACTFENLIIEFPIVEGVYMPGADLNLFKGGAVESVTRGFNIPTNSIRNHFINMDCESNIEYDVSDFSQGNIYTNCSFSSPNATSGNVILGNTSASTVIDNGYIGKLLQNSTQVGAVQLNSVKFDNRPGYAIQGSAAYRTNGSCQKINIFFSPVAIPTEVIDSGAFTPSIAGATTPGTQTYSNQKGVGQRIGQIYHFQAQFTIATNSGGVGPAVFNGLQFPNNSTSVLDVELLFTSNTGVTFTGGRNRMVLRLNPGASVGILIESTNGSGDTPVLITALAAGLYKVSGSYLTS